MLLCYITDSRQLERGERLLDKIAAAASAGVDYIQLREKHLPIRELEKLAHDAVAAVRASSSAKTKLLINSRVDVALATGADGVHLTSNDISAADARAIAARRSDFIVGVSCHTVPELQLAWCHGADFAVFGPVFEKAQPIVGEVRLAGIEGLRAACAAIKLPVLALGGITMENARACVEAGAAGVAAIRMFQTDAAVAIRHLRGDRRP